MPSAETSTSSGSRSWRCSPHSAAASHATSSSAPPRRPLHTVGVSSRAAPHLRRCRPRALRRVRHREGARSRPAPAIAAAALGLITRSAGAASATSPRARPPLDGRTPFSGLRSAQLSLDRFCSPTTNLQRLDAPTSPPRAVLRDWLRRSLLISAVGGRSNGDAPSRPDYRSVGHAHPRDLQSTRPRPTSLEPVDLRV